MDVGHTHGHAHRCAGIKSGTRAAAAGGVTTVIDMPLNSFPVTTTVEQLRRKMALARVRGRAGRCLIEDDQRGPPPGHER